MAASPPSHISAAEQSTAAQIGGTLFRHRGWLPILFLGVPLVFPGHMSVRLWIVGLLFVGIGEAWRLAGVAAAGGTTRRRSRGVQRLVTYGVFAWNRNPLYAGNFLIWLGFAIISGVFWFFPIVVLLFAFEYSLIVRYEEGVLETTFGDVYLRYKEETPRWIPRPPSTSVGGEHDWGQAWRSETSTFLQYVVLLVAFVVKSRYSIGGRIL
ncbi:MAG TPA: isoprenylcysteine carboxylmethyltransferase family protein [Gemmatimonadaceae bacterium]|jgi:protein-S-isoprenylcysteine O-methyltransferase Ste14|nr:isoprenylcysteine carboxylmethyltransferase family protein [Gemmatimonadaceae bacterium]